MDLVTIEQFAQHAIDTLKPLIKSEAAKTMATQAIAATASGAASAWTWLKSKFAGKPAAAAVQEAEDQPAVEENWDMLRLQILKALKDPTEGKAFGNDLARLLNIPAPGSIAATQTANLNGSGNKSAQVAGNSNNVAIN